jgi:serine phosphatase RsbU (regulator of sigma subunit)
MSVPFKAGDTLLLYSDALIETAGKDGRFMQESEIIDLLLTDQSTHSMATLNTLLSAFYSRYSDQPSDDLSLLVCRYSAA